MPPGCATWQETPYLESGGIVSLEEPETALLNITVVSPRPENASTAGNAFCTFTMADGTNRAFLFRNGKPDVEMRLYEVDGLDELKARLRMDYAEDILKRGN